MTESWGARSTVTRAVQRVVRSFVAWGVVVETSERGIFAPAPKIGVHDAAVGAWLLEAGIADTDRQEYPLHSLVGSVLLYPFDLRLSARDVTRRPRLEIHHQKAELEARRNRRRARQLRLTQEIDIDAGPELVFQFFTEAELLRDGSARMRRSTLGRAERSR